MGIRRMIGRGLEKALGKQRTDVIRRAERTTRRNLAQRLSPEPTKPAKQAKPPTRPAPKPKLTAKELAAQRAAAMGYLPRGPIVPHREPTMTRHQLLKGLHERLQPRTYLEVGIADGGSLTISRARSIGIDPRFVVRKPIHCDVQLVRATSDDFFARPDALAHFDGVPIDLAFIDGMHLADYALRDFMNIERHMADTGVAVFDDVLPRNALEAARERKTHGWTGDVYKAVEVLMRRRPDLVVLLVNTSPTGTALVASVDPNSTVLDQAYEEELDYLTSPDPQSPPHEFMSRSLAVDPHDLLGAGVWVQLVARRDAGEQVDLSDLWAQLRALPTCGPVTQPAA